MGETKNETDGKDKVDGDIPSWSEIHSKHQQNIRRVIGPIALLAPDVTREKFSQSSLATNHEERALNMGNLAASERYRTLADKRMDEGERFRQMFQEKMVADTLDRMNRELNESRKNLDEANRELKEILTEVLTLNDIIAQKFKPTGE